MAPAAAGPSPRRRFAAAVVAFALAMALALVPAAARPDKEMREKFYGSLVTNGTRNTSGEGSIAEMFGRVLDKEFSDSDTPDAPDKNSFNNSISDHQAVLETVAVITHDKKKNDSQQTNSPKPFQIGDMFGGQDENSDDLETVIDKEDNVFVMSNRKTKYPTLQLDLSYWWWYHFLLYGAAGYCWLPTCRFSCWTWGVELDQRNGAGGDFCTIWCSVSSFCSWS